MFLVLGEKNSVLSYIEVQVCAI